MKKILFFTAAVILSISVLAQDTKEKNTEVKATGVEWQKKIIEELKLSDAQIAKLDELNKELKTKIEALKQKTELSTEASFKEKKTALKNEKEAAFIQILTPEQQVKYKEMLEKKNSENKIQPSNKPA